MKYILTIICSLLLYFGQAQNIETPKHRVSTKALGAFSGIGDQLGTAFDIQYNRIIYKKIGVFGLYENASFSSDSDRDLNQFDAELLAPYIGFGKEKVGHTNFVRSHGLFAGLFIEQSYARHTLITSAGIGWERYHFTYLSSIAPLDGDLELQNRYESNVDLAYSFSLDYYFLLTQGSSLGVSFNFRTTNISAGILLSHQF